MAELLEGFAAPTRLSIVPRTGGALGFTYTPPKVGLGGSYGGEEAAMGGARRVGRGAVVGGGASADAAIAAQRETHTASACPSKSVCGAPVAEQPTHLSAFLPTHPSAARPPTPRAVRGPRAALRLRGPRPAGGSHGRAGGGAPHVRRRVHGGEAGGAWVGEESCDLQSPTRARDAACLGLRIARPPGCGVRAGLVDETALPPLLRPPTTSAAPPTWPRAP